MRIPTIMAHSGCEDTQPNTLAYLQAGLLSGADILEVDTQLTGDGVAIAWHDEKIHGCWIRETPYRALKERAPELLTLNEALAFLDNAPVGVNLDYKSTGLSAQNILKLATREEGHALSVSGVWREDALRLRREGLDGHAQLWMSPESEEGEAVRAQWAQTLRSAKEAGCERVNVRHDFLNAQMVQAAHAQGMRVQVWTVDRLEDMERALQLGVDGITTNRVRDLRGLLEKR